MGKSYYGLGLYSNPNIKFSVGVLGGWYSMYAYYPEDKTSIVILLDARSKTMNIALIMSQIHQTVTGKSIQSKEV